LIPFHLFVLISALLCSNHINRKFGKGLPPKIYRLDYQGLVAGTPTGSSVNVSRVERKRIVSQQPEFWAVSNVFHLIFLNNTIPSLTPCIYMMRGHPHSTQIANFSKYKKVTNVFFFFQKVI
jgi:hypothetical protein